MRPGKQFPDAGKNNVPYVKNSEVLLYFVATKLIIA